MNYLTPKALENYKQVYFGANLVDGFQRSITRAEGALSTFYMSELREMLERTEEKFEQEPVNDKSVTALVKSILDSGKLYQPITVTEYDEVTYITGGRHRTLALLYISEFVLGLDEESSTIEAVQQFVSDESDLFFLVNADNASRTMRAAEKAVTSRLQAGISKEMSITQAVVNINNQEHSLKEVETLLVSLVVSANREQGNRILPQTVLVVTKPFVAKLVKLKLSNALLSRLLEDFWKYFSNNYGSISHRLDGVVARRANAACAIIEANIMFDDLTKNVPLASVSGKKTYKVKEEVKAEEVKADTLKKRPTTTTKLRTI